MNDLKTWEQAKDFVHDASGIECPSDWAWHVPENSPTDILYPAFKIDTYRTNGQTYVSCIIDDVVYDGDVITKTMEHGGENYETIDYVDWGNNAVSDERSEQIEEFLDANFVDYITEAESL